MSARVSTCGAGARQKPPAPQAGAAAAGAGGGGAGRPGGGAARTQPATATAARRPAAEMLSARRSLEHIDAPPCALRILPAFASRTPPHGKCPGVFGVPPLLPRGGL